MKLIRMDPSAEETAASSTLGLPQVSDSASFTIHLLKRDWPWIVIILLLNLVFFSDALFTDKTFFVRDVSFFHYPLKKLVTEAYSRGEWPLWNPYIQLGQPLLANPNSMALYPTQILFQLLPFDIAFDLHFVLHCVLAGVGTYYLARTAGLSHFSAFLSAGIYNFSGVTLSFVNLFNVLPVVALLPLLSLALIKSLRAFSLIRTAVTSLLFAIFFLLLEPLSSIAAGLFIVPFTAALFLMSPKPRLSFLQAVSVVSVILASGVLMASIQILPTSELIEHSGRKGGLSFEVVSFWSMHPVSLLQLVAPRLFGEYFRLSQPAPWGSLFFDGREPYLLSCYVGVFSFLLGMVGLLLSNRRWVTNLLVGISVMALLLAMGKYTPVFPWLFEHVPPFRYGRYPIKYMYVVNLCLSLLAGFGFERMGVLRDHLTFRSKPVRIGFYILVSFVLLLLLLLAGFCSPLAWDKLNQKERRIDHLEINYDGQTLSIGKSALTDFLQQAELHLGLFILFLLLVRWKKVRIGIIRLSVASLILFDLFTNNLWVNPLIPSDLYDPAPAALYLNELMREEGPYRIYRLEEKSWQEHPPILGQSDSVAWVAVFRKLSLFQFLSAKDHVQYSVFNPIDRLETLPSQSISYRLQSAKSIEEKLEVLTKLNVGYVLSLKEIKTPLLSLDAMFELNSSQPLRVYKLVHRLPRVLLLQKAEGQGFDLEQELRLGGGSERGATSAAADSWSDEGSPGESRVKVSRYASNHVEIEGSSIRDSLLVLLDGYYPGWRATIDGQETPIRALDYGFRGIEFPAGSHQVHFSFEPAAFRYGLYIASFTALAWVATLTLRRFCTKRG